MKPGLYGQRLAMGVMEVLAAALWVGAASACGGEIAVPKEGSAAARTQALWQTIKPLILADAKADWSDAEYLEKQKPIHEAWRQLEWDTAETSSEEVSQFRRRVWMLIGDLYSDAPINPAYRQKVRARTKAKIEQKLADLDETAASLK